MIQRSLPSFSSDSLRMEWCLPLPLILTYFQILIWFAELISALVDKKHLLNIFKQVRALC